MNLFCKTFGDPLRRSGLSSLGAMGAGVNRRPKDLGLEAGGFAAGLEGGGFSVLEGGGFSAGFEGLAGEGEAAGGFFFSSGFPSSAWTSASPSSSIATATTNVLFILDSRWPYSRIAEAKTRFPNPHLKTVFCLFVWKSIFRSFTWLNCTEKKNMFFLSFYFPAWKKQMEKLEICPVHAKRVDSSTLVLSF
jgi:hypothetical protein